MDNCGAILANKLSKRKVTKVLAGCSSSSVSISAVCSRSKEAIQSCSAAPSWSSGQGLLPALATSRWGQLHCLFLLLENLSMPCLCYSMTDLGYLCTCCMLDTIFANQEGKVRLREQCCFFLPSNCMSLNLHGPRIVSLSTYLSPFLNQLADIWAFQSCSLMPRYPVPGVSGRLSLRRFRREYPSMYTHWVDVRMCKSTHCVCIWIRFSWLIARTFTLAYHPPVLDFSSAIQGRTHWVLKEAISAEDQVIIIDDIVRTEILMTPRQVADWRPWGWTWHI